MEKSYHNTRTTKYFGYLNMLWPNVQPLLLHITDLVGTEIKNPKKNELFLDTVLKSTQKAIQLAERDGSIQYHTRDRDVLIFFLRGICMEVGRLLEASVQAGSRVWNPCKETFVSWRQQAPSEALFVQWPKSKNVSAETVRQAAELVLGEKELQILEEDLPRIWGVGAKPTEIPNHLIQIWENPLKSPLRYV